MVAWGLPWTVLRASAAAASAGALTDQVLLVVPAWPVVWMVERRRGQFGAIRRRRQYRRPPRPRPNWARTWSAPQPRNFRVQGEADAARFDLGLALLQLYPY
jgi:hypothetical protein